MTRTLAHRPGFRPRMIAVAALTAVILAGCSSVPSGGTPDPDTAAEIEAATPASYPVPQGCPGAEDFATSFTDVPTWVTPFNASLLNAEVTQDLPEGGCAYALGEPKQAKSTDDMAWRVIVGYFRLGEEGNPSLETFRDWGLAAGGVPAPVSHWTPEDSSEELSDTELALPDSFSGWSNSRVRWADGEAVNVANDDENTIPEYTQGASAKIEFALDAAKVESMLALGDGSADAPQVAPAEMMASGLAATFSAAFSLSDEQGYTAQVELAGQVDPFTADIANSPPGEFAAVSAGSTSGTILNTTEGRKAVTPQVFVWLVYPAGSPACDGSNWIAHAESDDRSHCALRVGEFSQETAEPGGSVSSLTGEHPLKVTALDEASDALAQMNAPVAVYAVINKTNGRSMGPDNSWRPDQGCQVEHQDGRASFITNWVVPAEGWPNPLCG